MAWADEVTKDGRGVVYLMEISLDGFATTAYQYATAYGANAQGEFDPRLLRLGPITRGLAIDHAMYASSVDVGISNEDGAADWLVDQSSIVNVLKARVKLWQGLYDPATFTTALASVSYTQLGEYVIAEYPTRDATTIRLMLVDNSFGLFSQTFTTPNLTDWRGADASEATNPIFAGSTFTYAMDPLVGIQLAFGSDFTPCFYAGKPGNVNFLSSTHKYTACFPVCVTTSTAVVSATDITEVYAEVEHPSGLKFAGTLPQYRLYNGQLLALWTVYKSATISKGGKSWKLLWLGFDIRPLTGLLWSTWSAIYGESATNEANASAGTSNLDVGYWFKKCLVRGYPLSARATTSSPEQNPVDVITDLVSYYSGTDSSKLNAASLARVKSSVASAQTVSNTVGGHGASEPRTLMEVMTDIARSTDIDIFLKLNGTVALSSRFLDYASQTSTLSTIDEARIRNPEERVPSRDQRGAPFNRIYVEGKTDTRRGVPVATGPFDDPGGTVDEWNRAFPRTINQEWQTDTRIQQNPWAYRNLDGTPRPVLKLTTDLAALALELGDYVETSWSRGLLGSPHVSAVFQVEEISLDPLTNEVTLTLLWTNDLRTDRPYLLDDEDFLTRVAAAGGRTATVVDADGTVTFSSGNLVSNGVAAGDHLIIRDSSEDPGGFQRNRALKIASVTDATHLEVTSSDLDFDGGAAITDWEIRRSHLTYHTAVTDPTNYPDGGNLYGRVADASSGGVYSGAGTGNLTTAHFLMDG